MKFFYIFLNKIKRIFGKKFRKKQIFIILIIAVIFLSILFKWFFYIEKKNWDNRVGELKLGFNFFTYIPNITNVLYIPQKYFTKSSLPKYELRIKKDYLDEIEKTLPGFGGSLPDDKKYYPAKFVVDGNIYDVEMRIRGTLPIHWMYRQKSWRINFKNPDTFNGMESINLIIPESKDFLVEQYGNYLARKLGIVSMDTYFTRMKINGGSYGVYWVTEQLGDNFLLKHKLSPNSNLYSEDIFLTHTPLFSQVDYWKKYTHSLDREKDDYSDLYALLECLNTCKDKDFFEFARKSIDIENFVRWQAHTVIMGDDHQDSGHNNILYFNPSLGKFQFIPWDVNQFKFEGKADILYNPLVGRLLLDPDIMYRRNEILWEYVSNAKNKEEDLAYYDKLYQETKSAFYKDGVKRYSNKFFDYRVATREEKLGEQFDYLKNLFETIDSEYEDQKIFLKFWNAQSLDIVKKISVLVRGFSDISLKKIDIEKNISGAKIFYDSNGNSLYDREDEYLSEFEYDQKDGRSISKNVNKRIFAKRILPEYNKYAKNENMLPTGYEQFIKVVPTEHIFFIVFSEDMKKNVIDPKFNFANAVTGEKIKTEIRYINDNIINSILNR